MIEFVKTPPEIGQQWLLTMVTIRVFIVGVMLVIRDGRFLFLMLPAMMIPACKQLGWDYWSSATFIVHYETFQNHETVNCLHLPWPAWTFTASLNCTSLGRWRYT